MRPINKIIIHCSDTPEGRPNTVADITAWHKQRGFRTIGYHFVVYLDGQIVEGRPIESVGAHCTSHNRDSIGICYIGGRTSDMKEIKDTRTPEQKQSLVGLITALRTQFPDAKVYGHRDFACRACPCFNAQEEYKHL